MKQALKDFLLKLRYERKTQMICGFIVLALIALIVTPAPGKKRALFNEGQPVMTKLGTGASDSRDAYDDVLQAFTNDMKEIKNEVKASRDELLEQKKITEDNQDRTAKIFTKILDRVGEIEARQTSQSTGYADQYVSSTGGALPPDAAAGYAGDPNLSDPGLYQDTTELEPFGSLEDTDPVIPAAVQQQKIAFIGPADTVKVKLLAGVNAPTDGTPYPVIFEIQGDVMGPGGTRLPLHGARLMAASQGSISDARALFRLTELSMTLPNGRRAVYPVDGYLVGEDGIRGLGGKLVDHLGRLVPASGLLGILQGVANSVNQGNFTNTVNSNGSATSVFTGDTTEAALAGGASGGLNALQRIYADRLSQLIPYVEVLSGREATAVFAKSILIDGIFESYEDDNIDYVSLD